MDAVSHRFLRNSESRTVALQTDDRVSLVADPDEIAVVDPLLLQELDGGHGLCANEKEVGTARHLVICFGQGVRIVWWSIRRATSYQAMQVDVGQAGEFRVARIHAPNMAPERRLPAA